VTPPTANLTSSRVPIRTFVLAVTAALVLAACGPWGPKGTIAGGPFFGSVEPTPSDWSFTDAHPLIAIETHGRFFRHSVTILCVSAQGKLYVMARHAPTKRWVRNLLVDPRVRLEIGGKLYAGRALRVDTQGDAPGVAQAFLRKYVGVDAEHARALTGPPGQGDDRAELWTFRIDPPEGAS
jgi:hypothetical protein